MKPSADINALDAHEIRLRPTSYVMRLARMGAFHQTRLSFMRLLTRRMAKEAWTFARTVWDIDANGVGHACYTVDTGARKYTLVAFAHDLPDHLRSDRVIAEAWDATFTLHDGVPTTTDIARLSENVPNQEAGRISERELCLARANRSTRAWKMVINALARGDCPGVEDLADVGYLMRTTAVYGSGKFGAADHATYAMRPEFSAPFQAEMLTVYLIRTFVRDLANHMARQIGGESACALPGDVARSLGIGNSTGLGMAPFLINHPKLLHNWVAARETALARVRAVSKAEEEEKATFRKLLAAYQVDAMGWQSTHPRQSARCADLRNDLATIAQWVDAGALDISHPWDNLLRRAEIDLTVEAQEALVSLMLEPYPALCDPLADSLTDTSEGYTQLDGTKTVDETRSALRDIYGDLLDLDFDDPRESARAWYVSEEKMEPRLGERFEEPIADYEQPLDTARAAQALERALARWPGSAPVAEVVVGTPELRSALRRLQLAVECPYAEIRENTLAQDLMPIDMLRAKLSFFGATRFDPRSDRWVRINMFRGAPYPEELNQDNADFWVYPTPDVVGSLS